MRRLLAMLMAAILAMTLCTAVSEEETEEVLYYLTSFDCEDLDGNPVDISIFDGAQLVLIDCWEAWCHWCLEEMPDLNELYELNKDNGLMIVGLSGLSPAERFDPKATAELVDAIQGAYGVQDGIILNPGAYTHTSVALLDALKAVGIRTVEVHITDVDEREPFRRISYIRAACEKTISGHGTDGYLEAMDILTGGQADAGED